MGMKNPFKYPVVQVEFKDKKYNKRSRSGDPAITEGVMAASMTDSVNDVAGVIHQLMPIILGGVACA